MSIDSQRSIQLKGTRVPGAEDRQKKIFGFDQELFSNASVLCIGAGGLISHIAPALCRKGIGKVTILDDDFVEPSNLNRQRFYPKDLYRNKAIALSENLQPECIWETDIAGHAVSLEEAIDHAIGLDCEIVVCGVDNDVARVLASRHFRSKKIPVVFTGVSADADNGYVFVQEPEGPCFVCLYPDSAGTVKLPCPGTPAILDILQVVGALALYAIDTLLTRRERNWNYRRVFLSDGQFDSHRVAARRSDCASVDHRPT
jgi:molybdopterin/thiamine biosynthesis adenylyltransferase